VNFIEIRSVFLQSKGNTYGTGHTGDGTDTVKQSMPLMQHGLRRHKHRTICRAAWPT